MPTVDYLPIANSGSADVESQAAYVADLGSGGSLENGYRTGIALTQQVNKTWRQCSMIAAAVANVISQRLGADVLDDGDLTALIDMMDATFSASVDTIAELRTAPFQAPGVPVFVKGYYIIADGGGGVFYWDANSSAPDNGGTVILPTGHVGDGRWKRDMVNGIYWVSTAWFGMFNDRTGAENYTAINTALNSSPQPRSIYVPPSSGPYLMGNRVNLNTAQHLYTDSFAQNSALATYFKYDGASLVNAAVLSIPSGKHGAGITGIYIDANDLADYGYAVLVDSGQSTQQPFLNNVRPINYRTRGYVFGTDNTLVVNDGALEQLRITRLGLGGPSSSGDATAIGILLNAQNCEMVNVDQIFSVSSTGFVHANHIYAFAGGFHVKDYVSSGADDYGIVVSGSQFIADLIRTEDELVANFLPVQTEGMCELRNVLSRGSLVVPTDYIIYFQSAGNSQLLVNGNLNGSIGVAPTANRRIIGSPNFTNPAAGMVFENPQNSFYDLFIANTGEHAIRGRFQLQYNDQSVAAHVGGGQANATQLSAPVNLVTDCASDHDSVKLLNNKGDLIVITNGTLHILDIYPQTGASIGNGATDAPYSLGAGKCAFFIGGPSTFWAVVSS